MHSEQLIELPLPGAVPKVALYLLFYKAPQKSLLMDTFVDWLVQEGLRLDRRI